MSEIMAIILALVITTMFIITERTVSFIYDLMNKNCNSTKKIEGFENQEETHNKTCRVICEDSNEPNNEPNNEFNDEPNNEFNDESNDESNDEIEYKYVLVPTKKTQGKCGREINDMELNEYGYSFQPNDDFYMKHKEYPIGIVKRIKDIGKDIGIADSKAVSDGEKTWFLENH